MDRRLDEPQHLIDGDEINLIDLITPLWHSRWVILITSFTFALGGFVWAISNAQYKSEGAFKFGESITFSDYKRYSASFFSDVHFSSYVENKKIGLLPDMKDIFTSPIGISKIIEPIYNFSKIDAKEGIERPKEDSSNIIGLKINYSAETPEKSQERVKLLGEYVNDSILYFQYLDLFSTKKDELIVKRIELENLVLASNELLVKYNLRKADLKLIVSRFPVASNSSVIQLVTVDATSAHYLPPVTLLASTEVQISEVNEAIRQVKIDQKKIDLFLEYYKSAISIVQSSTSGLDILTKLEKNKEHIFKGKAHDSIVSEVKNKISIENHKSTITYLGKAKFISGPTLPATSTARTTFTLAISLFAGIFLSMMWVFLNIFWRHHRAEIMATT